MRKRFLVVGPVLVLGALTWRGNFTDFAHRSATSHLRKAEYDYHHGDLESAIVNLESALREDPKLLEARDSLGTLYQLTERRAKELQLYLDGVRIMPDDAQAHYLLGMCYYTRQVFAECATEMEACLKLGPYHPQHLHLLGMCYERVGRIKEAHALWQKGAHEHGDDPIIQRGLARTSRVLDPTSVRVTPASVSQPTYRKSQSSVSSNL